MRRLRKIQVSPDRQGNYCEAANDVNDATYGELDYHRVDGYPKDAVGERKPNASAAANTRNRNSGNITAAIRMALSH